MSWTIGNPAFGHASMTLQFASSLPIAEHTRRVADEFTQPIRLAAIEHAATSSAVASYLDAKSQHDAAVSRAREAAEHEAELRASVKAGSSDQATLDSIREAVAEREAAEQDAALLSPLVSHSHSAAIRDVRSKYDAAAREQRADLAERLKNVQDELGKVAGPLLDELLALREFLAPMSAPSADGIATRIIADLAKETVSIKT